MKIGILGNVSLNYSWFYLTHLQGLNLNGHEVVSIDYKSQSLKNLKERFIHEKFVIVFTHLSFHESVNPTHKVLQMYRDVTNKVGTKWIHTCNDARSVDRYTGDLKDSIHMAFVGTYDLVDNGSKAWNIPTFYSPYSSLTYDKMAEPVKTLAFDIPVFTGSPNTHPDRSNFIRRLQKRMSIKTFQTQSGEDLRHRTPELSVSAKCILGLSTGYNVIGYIDVRPFQYLGTGAFMIMRRMNMMDDFIPDEYYVPFEDYDNPAYVVELWNQWKHENTSKIRKDAFDFIQRYHSSKVRMENVMRVIEGKQDSVKATIYEF